jgi:hypothetical protein
MWLIVRELIGWLLVAVGLAMIGFVLFLANSRAVLEALAVSLPATVVFRCGIGLVKLAFAARVATNLPVGNIDRAG